MQVQYQKFRCYTRYFSHFLCIEELFIVSRLCNNYSYNIHQIANLFPFLSPYQKELSTIRIKLLQLVILKMLSFFFVLSASILSFSYPLIVHAFSYSFFHILFLYHIHINTFSSLFVNSSKR